MTDAKIVLENLSVRYEDGSESLRGVTLSIPANAITVLFGPAGSGKSTLLRTINRLNDLVHGVQTQGRVLLDGQDVYAPHVNVADLRRQVGMVFAQPVPLPGSIRYNLEYGPRLRGERDPKHLAELARRALTAAALWDEVQDRLEDPAIALSGGQQQRLCLARVLVLEPEVILLDEPTSGLDPISTARVEESLQVLKRDYTIVIAPHSIQQAARIADWAAFLLQGELIEFGEGQRMFMVPQDKRTEDYITGRFG